MHANKFLGKLTMILLGSGVTACNSNYDAIPVTENSTMVTPVAEKYSNFKEEELKEPKIREKMVFFSFDNFTISPKYQDILTTHALYLTNNPAVRIRIEGHADERGTPEYNIALGESRAEAVRKYLQALGVQNHQMETVSYGEEKPLVPEHDDSAYSKNRRSLIVYLTEVAN